MIRYEGAEFDTVQELFEYKRLALSETKKETRKEREATIEFFPEPKVETPKTPIVHESVLEKFKSMFRKEEGLKVAVALYIKAKEKGVNHLDLAMAREVCPYFPNFKDTLIVSHYRKWVNHILDGTFDSRREKRNLEQAEMRKINRKEKSNKLPGLKKYESFRRNFIDNRVKFYMSQDRFLTIEGARAKAQMDFSTRMSEKARIMRAKRVGHETKQEKVTIPILTDEQRDLFIKGMNDLAQGTISNIDKEYLQNVTATFYTKDAWSGFLAIILPVYPAIAQHLGIPDKFRVENYNIVYR